MHRRIYQLFRTPAALRLTGVSKRSHPATRLLASFKQVHTPRSPPTRDSPFTGAGAILRDDEQDADHCRGRLRDSVRCRCPHRSHARPAAIGAQGTAMVELHRGDVFYRWAVQDLLPGAHGSHHDRPAPTSKRPSATGSIAGPVRLPALLGRFPA